MPDNIFVYYLPSFKHTSKMPHQPLTILNELAACSNSPVRPSSVKYLPVQLPSRSGDTTSSETALSSRTFFEMCCEKKFRKAYMKEYHFWKVYVIVLCNILDSIFESFIQLICKQVNRDVCDELAYWTQSWIEV